MPGVHNSKIMENPDQSTVAYRPSRMIRKIKYRGVVFILAVLVAGYYIHTATLSLKQGIDFLDVPRLLGFLLLFTLFVERSIEFILSLWRSAEAESMDRQLDKLKLEISRIESKTPGDKKLRADKMAKLEQDKDARSVYRSETKFAALWLGFGIGVGLAFAGVRVLGNIFSDFCLSDLQLKIFVIVDIIFTGTILAGGSEGIHKIMKIYNSFTEKVEARNKAAREEK